MLFTTVRDWVWDRTYFRLYMQLTMYTLVERAAPTATSCVWRRVGDIVQGAVLPVRDAVRTQTGWTT